MIMKTRAIILLIFLFSISSVVCYSQQKEPQANRKPGSGTSSSVSSHAPIAAGTGLDLVGTGLEGDPGSIYLGEDWPEGNLILKSGKMVSNYRFRYDIYADQMQFISEGDTLAFASPSELYSITFGERTFVYEPYECNSMLMKGYFELVVPGKKQLLLKRTITYHLPDDVMSDETQSKYLVSECYFLKNVGQPAQKLVCSRKQALEVMGDKKSELEEYMKKTGNKVKTPNDLKKMVEYYNSLE